MQIKNGAQTPKKAAVLIPPTSSKVMIASAKTGHSNSPHPAPVPGSTQQR